MIKDRMSLEEKEEYDMMMAMRFRNEEEGFGFYNKYAKGKGFSVRKDYTRRDSLTKMVFHRRYTCSRQGYRKDMYMDVCNRSRQPRALTRCGCEAQFEIKHDKRTGEWYVLKFVGRHNHELCKPDEVAFLRSHRGLTDAQKAKVIELKDVGLRQCQVMDVMERDHGGFEAAGFVTRDLYNYFVRQKKKRIEGGDADRVIKYMQARQKDDMEFFFGYETDHARCLKRLFWSDPQSRIDYDTFGDVVVFDSTYRVNKYNLPFIPFVGVNHHGCTVIFGCAIVSDEKVTTYEWILKQFLICMCQKHPKSLITDGDNSMRRAIIAVMPNSDHRLCTWHIEQNMARHLRADMLADFRTLVHAPIDVDEFERKWEEFKVNHHVSDDNLWLKRMYKLRKKWAAAYTKGRIFLGMKSNQRSESLNSSLHKFLGRKMSLVLLVEHYEHCLSRIRHREAELDAKASQSVQFTSSDASPIEKHASHVLTPRAFKKVKLEIYKAMDWEVIDTIDEDTCVRYVVSLKENQKIFIVTCKYEASSLVSIDCLCRKLQCECIPCEHIFSVINYVKLDSIPQPCIVRRWTMKAKGAFPSDRYGEVYTWSDQMERYRLLRAFGSEVFFKASLSEDVTLEVMNLLENLSIDIEGCETVHKDEVEYGHVVGQSMRFDIANGDKVLDPTDVVPKGAPTKRMRGFLEKRARRCGYCRHPGHTIRSCPIYLRKATVDV